MSSEFPSESIADRSIDYPWSSWIPRYLVPIDPKRMGHYFTDVLVIGGGLAGLRAAHEIDPSLRTIILTKDKVEESNSAYAQGG
ncbi:MAG: FAD-binding protein, partial [Planctomycetota bacterium]